MAQEHMEALNMASEYGEIGWKAVIGCCQHRQSVLAPL